MKVLFVVADNQGEYNSSAWRCEIPARAINLTGIHEAHTVFIRDWVQEAPEALRLSEEADVIVVQRLFMLQVLSNIVHWQARGKVVIGDVDDAYHWMPHSVMSFPFWHQGKVSTMGTNGMSHYALNPIPLRQLEMGAKVMDAITAPSRILLEDWLPFNRNCIWVPNFIDSKYYHNAYQVYQDKHIPDDKIILGWGGSLSHYDSFMKTGASDGIAKVLKARPNTKILIAGDPKILDSIKCDYRQKGAVKWTSFNLWPETLARFDIGLIPLGGQYDKRRSWIKSIEYLTMGIPWVGTDSRALEDVADFGIMIPDGAKNWERALNHMIDRHSEYKQRAEERRDDFIRVDIYYQAHRLVEIYQEILDLKKG